MRDVTSGLRTAIRKQRPLGTGNCPINLTSCPFGPTDKSMSFAPLERDCYFALNFCQISPSFRPNASSVLAQYFGRHQLGMTLCPGANAPVARRAPGSRVTRCRASRQHSIVAAMAAQIIFLLKRKLGTSTSQTRCCVAQILIGFGICFLNHLLLRSGCSGR